MTDLIDHADSGDIHRMDDLGADPTRNLAAYCLRRTEIIRSTIYGPSPAAETMILDNTGVPYRYKVPVFTPLSRGPDAWIFDITGEIQQPPTGNPPTLPPIPSGPAIPQRHDARPADFRPAHRRRLDRLVKGFLIGAGVVATILLGVDLAALLVMGVFR